MKRFKVKNEEKAIKESFWIAFLNTLGLIANFTCLCIFCTEAIAFCIICILCTIFAGINWVNWAIMKDYLG